MHVGKATVAVITGASGGVGRATARLLAERGAAIGLIARGHEGLEGTKQDVEARGGKGLVLAADVSKYPEVWAAAEAVERAFGPIDLWVNNAMVSMYSPFMEMTPEEFEHVVAVTFLGNVHGTRCALERMLPRDRGTIVQVGSALAFQSIPLQSAYCASKHAIKGFSEAIRCELIHRKSRVWVSQVHMPALNTTQFTWTKNRMPRKVRPAGRIYQPEVAARAILFAAERRRRTLRVGATTVEAMLGEKLFPGLLTRYLVHAAWEGAMLPEHDNPKRPDNFWAPLHRDLGAHGGFDRLAHRFSFELWLTEHRRAIAASLLIVGGIGALLARAPAPEMKADTPSIADYALIGDCHGTALVRRNGDVDWACLRRFDDSPAFGALLDPRGGAFTFRPRDLQSTTRRYLPETNVLETELTTSSGKLRLTDAFAMRPNGHRDPHHQLLRRLECIEGSVGVEIEIAPRFDYGRLHPMLRRQGDSSVFTATGGDQSFVLWSDSGLEVDHARVAIRGGLEMRAGEARRFSIVAAAPELLDPLPVGAEEFDRRLAYTGEWWRHWTSRGHYPERYRGPVVRSALLLKLLTCAPTGAIVAAPTTSLPERIGGVRNWDYRYAWVRDASMTMAALLSVGHREVAHGLRRFLERTCATASNLQIMYGCHGERRLTEMELKTLAGFRGSQPVRVGNQASEQLQLDVYGGIVSTAWLDGGDPIDVDDWRFLSGVVDEAARRWKEPDRGIWETRGEPQHFVHSKAMCWLALERGLQLAAKLGLPADVERWRGERDAIRASIETQGFDRRRGCFVRAYGSSGVDASLLRLPLIGFVAPGDPRFVGTLAAIREDLAAGPFLRRYVSGEEPTDGLPPHEGAFLLCGFWLVDVLAMQGKLDEAEKRFEELIAHANEVGLLPEEIDPSSGEFLGNFPQAFSHMALILAAQQLQHERTPKARALPVGERGDAPAQGPAPTSE